MENEPAAVALRRYEAGEYEECAAALDLIPRRAERVAFNRAVLEFRRSGFGAFERALRDLRPNPEPEDVASAADAPLFYSCALVCYRSCRFGRARALLDRLLKFVAETEPALARDVVLLAMEVSLRCRLPAEAAAIGSKEAALFRGAPDRAIDLYERLRLRAALMNRETGAPPSAAEVRRASSAEWTFLRARRQHAEGDHGGAIATLASTPTEALASASVRSALNGNLCALHLALGKPNLAAEYARRALVELRKAPIEEAAPEAGPICALNLGASLLKAKRPDEAFDRLVEAARHHPNNARIWLRLAECCAAKRAREEADTAGISARRVGSGPHAKLVVEGPPRPKDRRASGESNAIPALSMEFAALCLTNATLLLPEREPPQRPERRVHRMNPCDPADYSEYCALRREALLLYAHVSLALDDPATALECCSARSLSASSDPRARALSNLYAAEALVALDRPEEALNRLGLISSRGPPTKDAVVFAVWLNAAVCRAIEGCAPAVQGPLRSVNSPRALPLQLYVETCTGNVENCRMLLRKFARTSFSRSSQ